MNLVWPARIVDLGRARGCGRQAAGTLLRRFARFWSVTRASSFGVSPRGARPPLSLTRWRHSVISDLGLRIRQISIARQLLRSGAPQNCLLWHWPPCRNSHRLHGRSQLIFATSGWSMRLGR